MCRKCGAGQNIIKTAINRGRVTVFFCAGEVPEERMRMTREEFIGWAAPRIVLDSLERNLLPSPRIAQALFESNFGTSELAIYAKNLFGVKNNDQWKGKCYRKGTKECYDGVALEDVTADFRAYDSWEESVIDQGDFLLNRCTTPKYHPELKHYAELVGNRSYKDCARILKEKNYGTAPDYDQRVIDYVEWYALTRYDAMTAAQARAMITGEPEEEEEKKGMKIILTVGHSILKTGACTSADGRPYGGILEYAYNKGIVERVAAYLRGVGHQVDVLICPELKFAKSTEEKAYKLQRVNSGGHDLAVELHLNASKLHNSRGCEVLYISEAGEQVARRIQAQLGQVFQSRGVQKRNNLYMLTGTKPVAVMVESFFCDNSTDCAMAEKTDVALLIAQGIHGGEIKSQSAGEAGQEGKPTGFLYRVQTGAFGVKSNAEAMQNKLKTKGFESFITTVDLGTLIYRVQVGAFGVKVNAEAMRKRLASNGFDAIIVTS